MSLTHESIFDSFSQSGNCKTGPSHIADYNLLFSKWHNIFKLFAGECIWRLNFCECGKILEIIRQTLQGNHLCTSQLTFYSFGRYVYLTFVASKAGRDTHRHRALSFLSEATMGHGWIRRKWWRHHFTLLRVFLSNIIHVNKSLSGSRWSSKQSELDTVFFQYIED